MKRILKSQLSKYNTIVILLFVYSLGIAQNFQDTKGELSISSSGTANYTIPIATPPSLNGVAPIINLTYNSGARGGIAGQGWSISSISSITRIATRQDIDGFRDGVDFDDNDKLALDGQRLLLKTGTYWANNSTYETEYKSNIKIELIIHTPSSITGPTRSFIVTQPDGSRTWYGSRQGDNIGYSRTSRNAWYIVRHEDVYGNSINYEYLTFSSATVANSSNLYISQIKFGGNESQSLPHINSINFHYTELARKERDFIIGKSTSSIVTSSNPSYASQLLDYITVTTQNNLFRKYEISHISDDDGYQRVSEIKEINGALEESNPIKFFYDTTPTSTSVAAKSYVNNLAFENISLAGDFDGDGRIDFGAGNQLYTNLFAANSGNIPINMPNFGTKIFPATTITDNKLNQKQSVIKVNETLNSIEFHSYALNGNSQFVNNNSKIIAFNNVVPCFDNCGFTSYGEPINNYESQCANPPSVKTSNKFLEGDYNGDGISEVLIFSFNETESYNQDESGPAQVDHLFSNNNNNGNTNNFMPPGETIFPCDYEKYVSTTFNNLRLVDLNPSASVDENSQGNTTMANGSFLQGNQRFVADFNSDGKADIMVIHGSNSYRIVGFKQLNQSPWVELELLGEGILDAYSPTKQLLFGDYNGDGKTDIMLPDTEGGSGHTVWHIYYSNPNPNGGEFFVKESHTIVEYWPNTGNTYNNQMHWSNYYAMDVNKDGKSDLVRFWRKYTKPDSDWWNPTTWTINDHDTYWSVAAYTNTIGKTGAAGFTYTYHSGEFYSDSPWLPTPVAGNFKQSRGNTDLVVVLAHHNKLQYFNFNKDFNKDNRLLQVKESNDKIVHTIQYSAMEAPGGGLGNPQTDFYSSTNTATYPNIELIKNPTSFLVSKLTATVNGISKHQDFRYHGYVSNFVYGSIGFKRTTRSSWYVQQSDPKIWTTENNDISLRGANTITWSSTNGLTVFETTPTDLLSTKTNYFSTYTFPSKVYNVLLNQQTTLDALTGVKVDKLYSYDGTVDTLGTYGLQTSFTTNYYNGTTLQGTTTTNTPIEEYANNPTGVGNTYYIGKPKKVTTTSTIYNADGFTDTRTSEEKYTYEGANITKKEKKGHNTDYLVEDMTYDAVGNLLTKTVSIPTASPAIASRTIADEYEPTKRFVKKKIDHQDFVTELEYNALGQVKKSTNYLGVVSEFSYDNWGKLTQSKTTNATATQLITTTSYVKNADGGYTVTSLNSSGDNARSKTTYDVLGRVVKTTTKGFANNSEISKTIEYDALGRKFKESEPFFTSASKFTEYTYDNLHRPIQVKLPTSRIQTLSYSGLTTTSVDDGKTTTITVDALGNKVATTDPGGTINFTYFANGALKKTNYGGHEITHTIDGWGNKISTFDPNAGNPSGPNGGNYSYSYDPFGQILTETTPKGTTTYTYDDDGKVLTKKAIGDGADFNTIYAYNDFAQLESETTTTTAGASIDTYGYTYDSYHRLTITSENNAYLEHTKTIGYDAIGRIATETNWTKEKSATNFESSVLTKYVYNAYNGILEKLTDNNNAALWQLVTANEKMQTLTANLGNGAGVINITNTYNTDYYLTNQKHLKGTTFVVNNVYNFDAVKGNLMSRQNLAPGMNITESFTYDPQDQDRLKTWTNPVTGVLDSNVYDDRGRITSNNKLGTVSYNGDYATGIYRKDRIALNSEGKAYYNALNGNQIVAYNMFKSPISINESNKGKCNFMYNSHASRSRMLYDNRAIAPSTTRLQRKTKLYTDDGSTEVTYDHVANTIKIITFAGGDAYSAVLYNEKTRSATGTVTTVNNYLHRDYLGSIIAITDNAGVAIEKRHFDAWGNLAKIVNSSNVALPLANGLVVLDRGYTGHEHLKEVGLIHMNGRLYDPVLRSFLMPDNFVQQPENTQNYNRYSYVLNNPLRYTDPSGELFLAPLAWGITSGVLPYLASAVFAHTPFSFEGLAKTYYISAASALATYGIGSAAGSMFGNAATFSKAAFQALAHGIVQGGVAGISGGKFWSGFAAGAVSSAVGSLWTADLNGARGGLGFFENYRTSSIGMIAFGTLSSGVSAKLTGGNFWQGAAAGLIVSGLNHAMHKIVQRADLIGRLNAAGYNPNDYANLSDAELVSFAQKVLPELYAEANNPSIESRENLTDTKGKPANGLTVGGEFNPTTLKGSISKILISKSAFSSYLQLASTIGHELNHASDYINGNMARWYNKGGHGYRNAMSEAKAYNWQFNMPGAPVNLDAFSYYNTQVDLWNKMFNGFK
jgi:RHS repeat-associated protein